MTPLQMALECSRAMSESSVLIPSFSGLSFSRKRSLHSLAGERRKVHFSTLNNDSDTDGLRRTGAVKNHLEGLNGYFISFAPVEKAGVFNLYNSLNYTVKSGDFKWKIALHHKKVTITPCFQCAPFRVILCQRLSPQYYSYYSIT